VRWAVAIPQLVDDEFDAAAFRAFLAQVEDLGLESVWTIEQSIGAGGVLSPLEVLTYAAACTERVRLGCSVFVSPLHQPVHLAKAIGSLDHLSGGRLEVGLGLGGRSRPFAAFGITGDHLVTRFDEGVAIMKSLWTERSVTFEGRFWQLADVAMEPKPVQRPYPPLWFGGSAPAAVRRAVRHADGFFGAGSQTTTAFAEQVANARRELEATPRPSFAFAKRVYIAIDDDAERAREQADAGLRRIYGPDLGARLAPVAVTGPPEVCRQGLQEIADAGAELIVLNPLSDFPHQTDRLMGEVAPAVT